MNKPKIHRAKTIEQMLAGVPFVEWDRYTVGERFDHGQVVTVYGWIERDDEYKDFVLAEFFTERDEFIVGYTTSSDEYTDRISQIWHGEENHSNQCHRVENAFNIENAIELYE